MDGPIYVFFRFRWTAAWYQLSPTEQDALQAKIGDLGPRFGSTTFLIYKSSWSNERWFAFGVQEFPDVQSVQKYSAALEELGWLRYIDSETMLGTAWPSDG